jgi:shikimate dehydrogenase
MSISGATKLYGVVGDPIAHSLSPLIHNLWLTQLGIDAVYGALHLRTETAGDDLRALARAGYAGLNVTLPHKLAALGGAARRSPEAVRIGAANTLVRESDLTWSAYNTDVTGFAAAFAAALGNRPAGARVCLIGAGGSARAVVAHLKAAGARLAIVNRTRANAEQLAAALAPDAETGDMSSLGQFAATADALVNAASFGHAEASPPALPAGAGRTFFDLSYGKAAAPMLRSASDAGWMAHDGLPMLVAQAADAFELWFGVRPEQQPALAAVAAEVARRAQAA